MVVREKRIEPRYMVREELRGSVNLIGMRFGMLLVIDKK